MDNRNQSVSSQPVYISPVLIATLGVVGMFLFATWKAFTTQSFIWLVAIPAVPLLIAVVNRPDRLFMSIFLISAAGIWMPMMGNDVPLEVFLRYALVMLLMGAAVVRGGMRSEWNLTRACALLFLFLVVMVMAVRGIGIRQLGSALNGGKDYVIILSYLLLFLLAPGHIRLTRRQWAILLVGTCLLPIISVAGDLLYIFTGDYRLYYVFKPGGGVQQMAETLQEGAGDWRLQNIARINLFILLLLAAPRLGRTPHGRGVMALLLLGALFLAALSGFRGAMLSMVGVSFLYLWFRHPRRRVAMTALIAAFGFLLIVVGHFFAMKLPSPVQRVLSILPFSKVEHRVRLDAEGSSKWRLEIWDLVIAQDVAPHLFLGKGVCFDPNHLLPGFSSLPANTVSVHNAFIVGNYHSGPLALLVFFGLPGFLCFTTLLISAAVRHIRVHSLPWHNPWMRHFHLVCLAQTLYSILAFYFIYGDMSPFCLRLFGLLTFLEIMARTRKEEMARLEPPPPGPRRLVAEPPRTKAIRFA